VLRSHSTRYVTCNKLSYC